MGLRGRLLLTLLVALTTSFVLVDWVATSVLRSSLSQLSHANGVLSANNAADALGQEIDDALADAMTVATIDVTAEALDSNDPKNFAWFADQLMRSKEKYAALLVVDKGGTVRAANTLRRGGQPLKASLVGRKISDDTARYIQPSDDPVLFIPAGRPNCLSDLLMAGESVAGFALPIHDLMGSTSGTLILLVSSQYLANRLRLTVVETDGRLDAASGIVDSDGNEIAYPSDTSNHEVRLQQVESPSSHREFERITVPLEGAAKQWGWRLLAIQRSSVAERPVEEMARRLQIIFGMALILTSIALVIFSASLIAPIQRLTTASIAATDGSYFRSIPAHGTDEVAQLTGAINRMMATIEARERSLDSTRRELASILNAMPSAVFTVTADMRVDATFSEICAETFGESIVGLDIRSVFALNEGDEVGGRMSFWLRNIFGSDELQWSLSESEGQPVISYPRHSDSAYRVLEMAYVPIYEDKRIVKIMMIARDVTEVRGLQEQVRLHEARSKETLERVSEVAHLDLGLFDSFMKELAQLSAACSEAIDCLKKDPKNSDSMRSLMRALHTLKGNARMFRVNTVRIAAHEFEQLCVSVNVEDRDASYIQLLTSKMNEMRVLLSDFSALGNKILDAGSRPAERAKYVQIPVTNLERLRHQANLVDACVLAARDADGELAQCVRDVSQTVRGLAHLPLSLLWEGLEPMRIELTRELQKDVGSLEIAGDDVVMDDKTVTAVREALMHAVRNAIDHGIEPPAARLASNKPSQGVIRLIAASRSNGLQLQVVDDGGGIDETKVLERALKTGLVQADSAQGLSRSDILDLVFSSGLSTAKKVSDISGRGVGMDAIRSAMQSIAGTATVTSESGRGTTLTLWIPT